MKFRIDGSCWLTPGEREEVISELVNLGLIKSDNKRQLPLKSGGKTDIYANIRDVRSRPEAIRFLAQQFANPLQRLGVDRIVEVPEAVSPLAGHLSAITGLPLVTVREEAKEGRVTKGRFIGEIKAGERVAIIDDVITDGASKITALKELQANGIDIAAIVVMVDRQQGWKKKLEEAGFADTNIWAGMTLHDIRQFLIGTGLMQRCDPVVEKENRLIIALDGKPWSEVLPIIDRLRPTGCILKANDLVFTDDLNSVVSKLGTYGRVMTDIKFHDISNTVANGCNRLRATPPWAVTIHASGGTEMVKAAVETFSGTPTIVLAVTVLTSLKEECAEIYGRQPLAQVMRLAEMVWNAGGRGFVCSPEEVKPLREKYPEATIVTPGLRSPGQEVHDQKRVATFAEANANGASYFVGGRQFLTAKDPVAEVYRVSREELGVELDPEKIKT